MPDTEAGRRPPLYPGDKVIQTKNDYDLGVMNGAMGIVLGVMPNGSLAIDFDGRAVEIKGGSDALGNIQLAYATSIHKVQGSEFPCAVVIAHKSHSFLHHRNLLYTGVTRAQETAIILGDHWGIHHCARKRQVDQRKTFLSFLLHQPASSSV
jgi:exodeoxyribonuclease V alpha subunit